MTPGTIGLPGKCPAWYHSDPVNVCSATARTPGSSSTTRSISRNGSRCGMSAGIAARSRVVTRVRIPTAELHRLWCVNREDHEGPRTFERPRRLGPRHDRGSWRGNRFGRLGRPTRGAGPAASQPAERPDTCANGTADDHSRDSDSYHLDRNLRTGLESGPHRHTSRVAPDRKSVV